jgi:hypothetical protein
MPEETQAWEYRVEKFGTFWSGIKENEVEQALNEWGQDGWEVVSSVGFENSNKITVIAKRLLSDHIRRRRTLP